MLPPTQLLTLLDRINKKTKKAAVLNDEIFEDWLTFGRQILVHRADAAQKANAKASKEGKKNPRTSSAAQSELGKKGGKKGGKAKKKG